MTRPGEFVAARDSQATKRVFLRAVLLSEHAAILAGGCYQLWTKDEWTAVVPRARADAAVVLALGTALSFLCAIVLAAVMLRWRLPLWAATAGGGILGPLLGAGAMLL